ncbi:MAG: 4-vinyl reductase [Candidatus Diapherotrites archaeon]
MLNSFFDKFIFTNGLRYIHNNFFLINMPFVIVPTELLIGIVAQGDLEINTNLYYSVKDSMRKNLSRQFNLDFGMQGDRALTFVRNFFSASGWGGIKIIDFDPEKKRAIIVVSSSPIATALHGKAKEPVDHFLRGVFAGIFSNLLKTDLDCLETKCAAMNDKECEFIIKEAHEFDFNKKNARRQLKVE